MLNRERGEVALVIGSKSYILRPTFDTLIAIEEVTDKGAIELLQGIQTQTLKFGDMVKALWVAAKRNKSNLDVPSMEKLGVALQKDIGMVQAARVLLNFLGNAVSTEQQLKEALEESGNDTKDPKEPDPLEGEPSQEKTD